MHHAHTHTHTHFLSPMVSTLERPTCSASSDPLSSPSVYLNLTHWSQTGPYKPMCCYTKYFNAHPPHGSAECTVEVTWQSILSC